MIEIFTDGACLDGTGGWAAVIIQDGATQELKGRVEKTTSNRMELTATIEALSKTAEGSPVAVYSDSMYLVNTMTRNWKRQANLDLWGKLDALIKARRVTFNWVRSHTGIPYHERAHNLSSGAAGLTEQAARPELTHQDAEGRARMVDVTEKADTEREAIARGRLVMKPDTFRALKEGRTRKGDPLNVAQIAGIMAAKKTPELIPLCHPLLLTDISVKLEPDEAAGAVEITATVKVTGKTGVEMEALTAVAVAALTVYDMLKAVDKEIRIEDIRLLRKSGGKSGTIDLR